MTQDNEIVKLAKVYQQTRKRSVSKTIPLNQAIREIIVSMIENQPDDEEFGPDPIAGLITSSLHARSTVELHIALAVAAGYAMAAEDAMAVIEKAGNQAAERN